MLKLRALKIKYLTFQIFIYFILMLSFSFNSYGAQALNNGLVDFVGSSSNPSDYVIGVLQSINYHLTSNHSGNTAVVVYSTSSSQGGASLTCYTNMLSLSYPVVSFDSQSNRYITSTYSSNGTFVYCLSEVINQIPRNLNFYMNYFVGNLIEPLSGAGWLNNQILDMHVISYTDGQETYTVSSYNGSTDFISLSALYLSNISVLFRYYASRFYEWFYPLDNVDPEYWRYYNTDTQQSENIGLAGLMYNISWYLGQLYVLQSANAALQNMADAVSDAADTFTAVETQEHTVISSVSSAIENFNPDISFLGSLTAIAWVSNYLQQCFVSIGAFGTVIMLGLLLGVCMQFVGYFKYK